MKQRHRLRLLAVAILCAVPPTVPAQTVRLREPARPAPRVSHVPIEGGISPAAADEFTARLQQAETAQMERLLADLAKNPEKLGIKDPQDRKVLENALQKAGDQPEKMLQDPEVRKIIGEAAAKQESKRDLSPEDQERIKEFASRSLPPSEPKALDPGKPEQTPGKPGASPQAEMLDPVKPPQGNKPPVIESAPRPPEAGAAPPPPPPPTKSPVKDRLRDFAETLADRGLSDSPAFRRMMTNLGRVKAPEAGLGTWERRLEGFENRFAAVGARLPNLSWPKVDLSPRGPGERVGPDAGASRDVIGGGGEVMLVLLAAGAAALVAWGLLRRRGLVVLSRAGGGWRLGPWPVRPEAVHTRDELVRAFEYLALLLLGPAARSRNHHDIAAGLGQSDGDRRAAAERLAGLYEHARYAPPDEALPDADLAAARADLSLLAGVAAA